MIATMTVDHLKVNAQLDMLLTTKLHIPPLPSHYVSRPHLIQQLNEGLQGKLTLICAPAGFGKTSLLSEWHAGLPKGTLTVGWVSLDRLTHACSISAGARPNVQRERMLEQVFRRNNTATSVPSSYRATEWA